MDPEISVDPSVVPDTPLIDVNPNVRTPLDLSPNLVTARATRAAFATEDQGKSLDDIKKLIGNGQEETLRRDTAANIDQKNRAELLAKISDASTAKGGPLTSPEIMAIQGNLERARAFTDPTSVLEQEFTRKYFGELNNTAAKVPEGWWSQALSSIPEENRQVVDIGQDWTNKQQYVLTHKEDAETAANAQGYVGYSLDRAKELISFGLYGEAKLRGNVPGVGTITGGLGLGTNLQEQAKVAYRLPFNEFKTWLDGTMTKLKQDNPGLAVDFINYIYGMSMSDISLQNAMSAVNIATIPGTGTVGKIALEKAALLASTKQAVSSVARSTATTTFDKGIYSMGIFPGENIHVMPPRAAAASGVGDLGAAATERVAANVVSAFKGDANPAQEAVQALPRILDTQVADIAANPGRSGQEIVNRIVEAYNTTKFNLIKTVSDRLKVERISEVTASKEGAEAMRQIIKDDYPGPSERILNIGDPVREEMTNVHFVEVSLGTHDGKYFWSRDQAEAAAEAEGLVVNKPATTMRAMANKQFGEKAAELQYKITKLSPLANRSHEVARLKQQLEDLKTWHAGILSQPELHIPATTGGYSIQDHGLGFYISRFVPMPERSQAARDLLGTTKNTQTPDGFINSLLGWLRTPEETTSADARMNAKTAVYGASVLLNQAKEEMKAISKLAKWTLPGTAKKQRWQEFERTLKMGQTMRDPITGEMGYTYKTIGELEDHYQRFFHRDPIPQEIEAYFAFKRWVEIDAVHREMLSYRNKSLAGAETHTIVVKDTRGMRVKSPDIEAILRKEFPHTDDGVLVMGARLGKEKVTNIFKMSPKLRNTLEEGVKSGRLKVLEIYDPASKPLKGFGKIVQDARIRYVITDSAETKPLSFEQVGRRGGGHFDYDYDFYLKQAKVKWDPASLKHWYEGDTTVMPFGNGALGHKIADLMNAVRLKVKEKDFVGAAIAAKKLPMDVAEHLSWYNPSKGPGGIDIPPRLDVNEPFQMVRRNKMIMDTDKESLENRYIGLKDGTKQGSAARLNQIQYTGERDAYEVHTIQDVGTRHQPLYTYQPAEMVDPIPSMNRAMTRIINSSYMDDYKNFSVEHWMQEARNYMVPSNSELAHSPLYYFSHPEWKADAPIDVVSRLMGNRLKIQQILGTPSVIDNVLQSISQKLADTIYTKFGPTKLDPSWMLPKLTDAGRFLRSVTYNATIGLFAIPQFIVQSMTYVTIAGIMGGALAIPGTAGAFLHQLSRINPGMVEALDSLATKVHMPGTARWRPGEWKEANSLLVRTGFGNVGAEHALLDNPLSAKVVTNAGQQFLDAGTIFFKEGEKNARYGAWYTAYREFRELHPTGRITNYELGQIFDKAELLAGNMSSASKSLLQRGPMSFPTQFLAYNLRLAELMTGKRLDMIQKARLFTTYSALYGVPSAMGLAGLPIGDLFRKAALDSGYVMGDSQSSAAMEGLPSAFLHMITGNWYNIGGRFGSPGFDVVRDALTGDKPWWNLAGGASWSTISGAFESMSPFMSWAMSFMRDDDKYYPIKSDDMIEPLKMVTSINGIDRYAAALRTGNWMSKKGIVLDTASPLNALMMTLTGVQPQASADVHLLSQGLKDRKDNEGKVLNLFLDQMNRGFQSLDQNDPEQAKTYFVRGKAILKIGGFPDEKYSQAFSLATRGNETLISRINENYFMKNVPPELQTKYRDIYARRLKAGVN